MFAVIRDGSKQFTVVPGQVIDLERVDLKPGAEYTFDVLAVNKDGQTQIGSPTLASAKVIGEVVDEYKDRKLHVMRYRKREMWCRHLGHRQRKTRVKIKSINA